MTAPVSRAEAIARLTAPGQQFELEPLEQGGRLVRNFKHAPPSLRAMYEQYLSDLPFIVYEDERYTFAEAWRAASRIGHLLVHECGVAPGDRVAIAMRNYPEWMFAFTAITSIGAIAVAMNAHWQPEEVAHGLADSGARVLIADQERLDRYVQARQLHAAHGEAGHVQAGRVQAPPLPPLAVRHVLGVRATRLPDGARPLAPAVAALGDVPMPPVAIAPDDLATLLYTSGSSGRAKGVPSTHRNILAALMSWGLDLRINELVTGAAVTLPIQLGTLLAVPLFHVTGLHSSFLASYGLQRRVVSMYRWDPELAARLIDRERLTSIVAPAAITGDLIRVARAGGHDLRTLLTVGGGGAPRAPEQVRQIDASFENAAPGIGWGMTETNAIGTGNSGADYLARPASSGRCSQVLDLSIRDDAGNELPRGKRGELWVRGTSVFRGYWNLPEATAEAFVGDWFRTGDIAYLDDDDFLFIVDRLKDLIIRGGENIGCGHVEAALLMHPDVHEASVYAVPDDRMGEEVGATIYAADTLDDDRLREFLAHHLARFEIPRYIVRSPGPLPRTPSGKILKRQLRDDAIAQLASHAPSASSGATSGARQP
ncbi:MAG TPA: class I adenylate-forming enzyme family protein [Kofleriaceae bacterium]|nr:class I adenylate-forming enzyme family protein [Kofleriaceae bacterium]